MDRFAAMVILLTVLVCIVLMLLALFSVVPLTLSMVLVLLYSMYLFMAYEEHQVHHAQEFENRYWTVFGACLAAALLYCPDSPLSARLHPTLNAMCVVLSGYAMHVWDRHAHRVTMSSHSRVVRNVLRKDNLKSQQSLRTLQDLGIQQDVENQVQAVNAALADIDQLLIPSTVNNFINRRYVLNKEREIINIFETCDARALNYLLRHVKLALLFYKMKDHRTLNGKHRTEFIQLVAVTRLPILSLPSRVIVLHSLQLLKLKANPRAEQWVRNIFLNTQTDDLSELKTLVDSKGDYFCMNKLVYQDIKSELIRQDLLRHFRREAVIQQTDRRVGGRRRRYYHHQWRKVLSDVDDTLFCSGGSYPAGVDKRYPKKAVYPGVLAFYRELDLGNTSGDETWQDDRIGNLVFLSARPHLYKDISEKHNFAKFEKLKQTNATRLHTTPSLLPGDLQSGSAYIVSNDFEPLAKKKFDNFRLYVSIYPEFQHVFVCDNGQGDVRAGEQMFDSFPYEFEALYVHRVIPIQKTHGYAPQRWKEKEFYPYFFDTYPQAALHACQRQLISVRGLQRICNDAVRDFAEIKGWSSKLQKAARRLELNQAIWRANDYLEHQEQEPAPYIPSEQEYAIGERVRTPYGIGIVQSFEAFFDLYQVELDWRPLDEQVAEYQQELERKKAEKKTVARPKESSQPRLPTVDEEADAEEDEEAVEETQEQVKPSAEEEAVVDTGDVSTAVVPPAAGDQATVSTPRLDIVVSDEQSAVVGALAGSHDSASSAQATDREAQPSQCTQPGGQSSSEAVEAASSRPSFLSSAWATLSPPLSPTTTNDEASSVDDLARSAPPAPSLLLDDSEDDETSEPESRSIVAATEDQNSSSSVDGDAAEPAELSQQATRPGRKRKFPFVHARVSGRQISKFTPPVLPKVSVDKKAGRGLLKFLQPSTESSTPIPPPPPFKQGDVVTTPYGDARVIEYRPDVDAKVSSTVLPKGMVVVEMIGWNATCYLQQGQVKLVKNKGLLTSLIRQLSSSEKEKPLEFPHAEGTHIITPFGPGEVIRPIPRPPAASKRGTTSHAATAVTAAASAPDKPPLTLAISLESWTLSDGSHPVVYCTEDSARAWKESKYDASPSFLSTLGNLVGESTRTFFETIVSTNKKPAAAQPPPKLFDQYFQDSASVATSFGDGVVLSFRPEDGFYQVALTQWPLRRGKGKTRHAIAWFSREALSHRLATDCYEGCPVLVQCGKSYLTGTLASVEPTTGVHVVTIPTAGMVCYLQPDCVVRPIKACIGEDVLTAYGEGKVEHYDVERDVYTIALPFGKLYACQRSFDRVGDGLQDQDGAFGSVSWLLNFLFQREPASAAATARSRSNSVTSAVTGGGSQSGRNSLV